MELTNKRAEQALRELVVQRKIHAPEPEGDVHIRNASDATWKQRGLNLREALSKALARRSGG